MNDNATDANGTDALFEIIQKELKKIVDRGGNSQSTSGDAKNDSKKQPETTVATAAAKTVASPRMAGGGENSTKALHIPSLGPKEIDVKLDEMSKKYKTTLEKEIEAQTAALDSPRAKCIDADLQKMQMELQETYNAFQCISQKFESIDFSCLQKRIRDLNLSTKRDVVGRDRCNELRRAVDQGFEINRLNDLTNEMGEKFRKHSGEFGNIPEISSFFQACTQLEHCLGSLKRQHNDVHDLEERMRRSAEISLNRTNQIKQQLIASDFEDDSELKLE